MASTQAVDGEYLVERIGALELLFALAVERERLWFHHVGTRFRIGPLRTRLPRAAAPTIAASVGAVGNRLDVSVRISAPGVGTLLSYAGVLTPAAGR